MAYNHMISTREKETQLVTPVVGTAALQVVIGTAPVNLVENPAAAVNKPIIAYSYAEAVKALGYSDDYEKYTLCQSMDASFRLFAIAPVIFINVLDPSNANHKTAMTGGTISIVDGVAKVTEKGVLVDSNFTVKADADTALTKGTDYLTSFGDDGTLDITILETAATTGLTSVIVAGNKLAPSGVTASDIIGGVNASTGAEKGLEVIRQIYPKLGLTPGLILAPGWSHNASVAAVMRSKCQEINKLFTCEAVVDIAANASTGAAVYTDLLTAKTNLGVTDPHVILCWPKVKSGEKVFFFSAVWAAMTAYCDAQHGDVPYKSPSNELLNVTAAVLDDGTEVLLDISQASLANSYGIVVAINDQGWKSWGNNTSAYPGNTDTKDRWIACRRMMSWYRNRFILTYKDKVDDPVNPRLVEAFVDSENMYLNSLSTGDGAIAGGVIYYDEAANTKEKIMNGEVHFDTKIAFWTPGEWIENAIEFDPNILKNAMGGNS